MRTKSSTTFDRQIANVHARLAEAFPRPSINTYQHAKLATWRRGTGNGVIFTRINRTDVANGIDSQLHRCLLLAEELALAPRVIFAELGVGTAPLQQRPGLTALTDALSTGTCRWLVVPDLDRIARNYEASTAVISLLQREGVELYIARHGAHRVDVFVARFLAAAIECDRAAFRVA